MFGSSEIFALIKSTPNVLISQLEQILDYDKKFLLKVLESYQLNTCIDSINRNKHKGDRFIIWEPDTTERYSVFYSNYLDGWYSLLYNLLSNYKQEILIVYLDSIENKGKMVFYRYKNEEQRIVRSLYDDTKWTFFEKGKILPFENDAFYKRKKITDRMNNDIMREYLLKLGIDINNSNFYKSKKILFLEA